MRAVAVLLLSVLGAALLGAASIGASRAPVQARFGFVDVWVDSGDSPLAAYQFEFHAPEGVTIVGVESGEHRAYREAPHYDGAALTQGRIIVGALAEGESLPTRSTRVARLHLRIEGGAKQSYECTLDVAATPDERRIHEATLTVREGSES